LYFSQDVRPTDFGQNDAVSKKKFYSVSPKGRYLLLPIDCIELILLRTAEISFRENFFTPAPGFEPRIASKVVE
jgi:hypothetical protein